MAQDSCNNIWQKILQNSARFPKAKLLVSPYHTFLYFLKKNDVRKWE